MLTKKMVGVPPSTTTLVTSGLGMVLTYPNNPIPYEVVRTLPGREPFLDDTDPQHFTKGDYGYYYDTSLGSIPTDFDLATMRNYQPVQTGWVVTNKGFLPSPYVPPNAWRPVSPPYRPQPVTHLSGGETQEELKEKLWQQTYFYSAVGALAALIGMGFNIYRALYK